MIFAPSLSYDDKSAMCKHRPNIRIQKKPTKSKTTAHTHCVRINIRVAARYSERVSDTLRRDSIQIQHLTHSIRFCPECVCSCALVLVFVWLLPFNRMIRISRRLDKKTELYFGPKNSEDHFTFIRVNRLSMYSGKVPLHMRKIGAHTQTGLVEKLHELAQ